MCYKKNNYLLIMLKIRHCLLMLILKLNEKKLN